MGRLEQVSKAEASPEIQELYKQFFGDRDPVAAARHRDRHAGRLLDDLCAGARPALPCAQLA